MSPSLWFIVPVHGRTELARICLRQLRRTCAALTAEGLEASAVVIADRENLRALEELEPGLVGVPPKRAGHFAAVERDNRFLSRRFNDGIQLACDPAYNARPADYVVPMGSDDWVDHRILLQLPQSNRTVVGFQRMSFVREDGREISSSLVNYLGGCGIRIYTRGLMKACGYRPADEDRARGCDTSILGNVRKVVRTLDVQHRDVHDRQIVDFKSPREQLNGYDDVRRWRKGLDVDPWTTLADTYPAEAIEEMRAHYARIAAPRERELVA